MHSLGTTFIGGDTFDAPVSIYSRGTAYVRSNQNKLVCHQCGSLICLLSEKSSSMAQRNNLNEAKNSC